MKIVEERIACVFLAERIVLAKRKGEKKKKEKIPQTTVISARFTSVDMSKEREIPF